MSNKEELRYSAAPFVGDEKDIHWVKNKEPIEGTDNPETGLQGPVNRHARQIWLNTVHLMELIKSYGKFTDYYDGFNNKKQHVNPPSNDLDLAVGNGIYYVNGSTAHNSTSLTGFCLVFNTSTTTRIQILIPFSKTNTSFYKREWRDGKYEPVFKTAGGELFGDFYKGFQKSGYHAALTKDDDINDTKFLVNGIYALDREDQARNAPSINGILVVEMWKNGSAGIQIAYDLETFTEYRRRRNNNKWNPETGFIKTVATDYKTNESNEQSASIGALNSAYKELSELVSGDFNKYYNGFTSRGTHTPADDLNKIFKDSVHGILDTTKNKPAVKAGSIVMTHMHNETAGIQVVFGIEDNKVLLRSCKSATWDDNFIQLGVLSSSFNTSDVAVGASSKLTSLLKSYLDEKFHINGSSTKTNSINFLSNPGVGEISYNSKTGELKITKAGVHEICANTPSSGLTERVVFTSTDKSLTIIANTTEGDELSGSLDFVLTSPLASKWDEFKWDDPDSRWEPRAHAGSWDKLLKGISPEEFKEALDDLIDLRVEEKLKTLGLLKKEVK